jgi:hypothetical protein
VAANFLRYFKDMKDPRMVGKITYPLGEVLLLAVAATVSDGDGFVDMEDYGKEKLAILRQFLPYEDGVPTHGHAPGRRSSGRGSGMPTAGGAR